MRLQTFVLTLLVFAIEVFSFTTNARVFECGTPKTLSSSYKVDVNDDGKMFLLTKEEKSSETRSEMQFDFERLGFSGFHSGDVHVVFWRYGLMSVLVYDRDGVTYLSGAKCR